MAFSPDLASDLLYGFDLPSFDDDGDQTRDFLQSLITSGRVPPEDMREILAASVMRGVEEWDATFARARVLRDRAVTSGDMDRWCPHLFPYPGEKSILPFLGLVLEGGTIAKAVDGRKRRDGKQQRHEAKVSKKKRRRVGSKSPFWPNADDKSEETVMRRRRPKKRAVDSDNPNSAGIELGLQPVGETVAATSGTRKSGKRKPGITEDTHWSDEPPVIPQAQDEIKSNAPSFRDEPKMEDKFEEVEDSSGLGSSSLTTHEERPSKIQIKKKRPNSTETTTTSKRPTKSPYFTTPPKTVSGPNSATTTPKPCAGASPRTPLSRKRSRPPRGTVSALPVPPLSAPHFGLIQEELAADPFRLLVAVTFLIRTPGRFAIPAFRAVIARWPTPETLAAADPDDIVAMTRHLGLSAVRCTTIQKYARVWLDEPPCRRRRFGVKNYPLPGDGANIKAGEEFGAEDEQCGGGQAWCDAGVDAKRRAIGSAWEIGHLTQGRYAIDSWRIFCRDALLGRADDWTGKGRDGDFQPEWMRVLPEDKELRACLRWMWMREGWEWDPATGEREVLRQGMRRAVDDGRVGYDDTGRLVILDGDVSVVSADGLG